MSLCILLLFEHSDVNHQTGHFSSLRWLLWLWSRVITIYGSRVSCTSEILNLFDGPASQWCWLSNVCCLVVKEGFEDSLEKRSPAGIAAPVCSVAVHPVVFWGRLKKISTRQFTGGMCKPKDLAPVCSTRTFRNAGHLLSDCHCSESSLSQENNCYYFLAVPYVRGKLLANFL